MATPNNCHARDVIAAVNCGKPVLVEKPMGMNAAECRQMVDAAAARGVLLGVAHIFRFAESVQRIRERVAAGDVGRVIFARAEFCYPVANHPRRWIHDAAIAGGGPVADVGVHCVDTLRFILGDQVASVFAAGYSDNASGTVEASAMLSLKFCHSALATVLVSARAQYRTPLELVGETGVLRADNALSIEQPVTIELWRSGEVQTQQASNTLAYSRQVDAFAAAVEGRSPFPASGEEGRRNQLVLDAAYRSMKTGSTEDVTTG